MNILSLRGRFFFIFVFIFLGCSKYFLTEELLRQNNYLKKRYDYINQVKILKKILKIVKNSSSFEIKSLLNKYGFKDLNYIYLDLGDLYIKLNQNNKALLYLEKIESKEPKIVVEANREIAEIYIFMGLYNKAIKILNKNLNFHLNSLLYRMDKLNTYELLAECYINIENNDELKKIIMELRYLSQKYFDDTGFSCEVDIYLGKLFKYMKEYNKSENLYKNCLNIAKDTLNKNPNINNTSSKGYYFLRLFGAPYRDIVTPNILLGELFLEKGDYKIANKYLEEAKKYLKIQKFVPKIYLAIILRYQSDIASKENKHRLALKLLQESIKAKKELMGEFNLNNEYALLSSIYSLFGDDKLAYEYSKKMFDIFFNNTNRNFTILDNGEKREYINKNKRNISLLLKQGYNYLRTQKNKEHITKTIFNSWLKYKGTIFEYQNILSTIYYTTSDKKVKSSIDKLKSLTIQLDNLDNSDIKPKNYKEIKEKIEEQIHNIEVDLSKESQRFKEQLDLKNIDYKEIAKNLKKNQLYIDFAKAKDNYYIFTLDNRENITFKQIDENQTEIINKNIKEFLNINKKIAENINNQKLIRELKPKTDKILSKLYNLLIDKSIENKKEIDRLIISPDGILNFFPFEVLFNGKNYLIEKYIISYISSGREFIRQTKRKNSSNSNEIIVFANMDFQLELPNEDDTKKGIDNITLFDIDSLSKLDATKEIEAIKSNFKDIKIYQEESATVENLFKIKSPKILHISTHGIYLNNKNILNPMRRSALAFSGADNANYIGDARGFATALKLSNLNLEGTELVVLSACESGLGIIQDAEGVFGLPKAFIQAGAKNIVISLWEVSNNKSALLMRYFYDNIAKGKDYITALRDAKLKMLDLHPYFWSAFIIVGI